MHRIVPSFLYYLYLVLLDLANPTLVFLNLI